ncbi:hypothetical protein FLONG3_3520 [Fusarium longipes]|uniref:F-box domain-containing protein n=1 Tax=Fusarium longipes TaxID=694270 RepID=A0A395T0V6_9HYPO|nr:hypothetical protein FLONG3_3520 [Fusarium longipes]
MEVDRINDSSWPTTGFTKFEYRSINARTRLSKLTQLARNVALKKPNDVNAQRRAQAAMAVMKSMGNLPHGGRNDHLNLRYFAGDYVDNSDPHESSRETSSRIKLLPTEIHQLIIGHVNNLDCHLRLETLVTLSSVCKTFMVMAEKYIYERPVLQDVVLQWMFLYSLKVEPSRASHVKSLELGWMDDGSNSQLLMDIASCCPTVKDLDVQRGQDKEDSNEISHLDILAMGSLLSAFPQLESLHYSSVSEPYFFQAEILVDVEEDENGDLANPLDYPGFKEAGSRLKQVVFGDVSEWLIQTLTPHLSSKLTKLEIGADNFPKGESPLSTLSVQCPNLEELKLEYTLGSWEDLERACRNWGPTLRTLQLASIEERSGWIKQMMPFMTALETLDLGSGCEIATADINAIGQSNAPLENILLEDSSSDGIFREQAGPGMNIALANMITVHSSRLKVLDLGDIAIGPPVLRSCKRATRLTSLRMRLSYHPAASEVDDLLITCPDLKSITKNLTKFSRQKDMWEERTKEFPKPLSWSEMEIKEEDPEDSNDSELELLRSNPDPLRSLFNSSRLSRYIDD